MYIGQSLQVAYPSYTNIDDISGSFNGVTTSFALTVGGVAPVPAPLSSNQCMISVGGVVQRPDDTGAEGFRLSGGSIVFSSAPNTGEDFFGVILAGADYINVGANFPSGSASTPSITFDTDLDTGIYNPASNQLGIVTAGVSRATVDSSGSINIDSNTVYVDAINNRVGIGTSSPATLLHVAGDAQVNSLNGGPLSGARNRIINGDMRINQRNATQTVNDGSTNFYSVDRWLGTGEATDGVFTLASSTSAPAGFTNSLLATVTTADASIGASQRYIIAQRIEGNNVSDLAWGTASAKAVTLSFWVFSSLTGTFGGVVRNSAGDRSYPFSYSISAANTWEQKTVSITGDTSGTWLTDTGVGINLAFSLGVGSSFKGTAGAWSGSSLWSVTGAVDPISTNGSTFRVTGVQLEAGTVATPFERRSYGQELALCQRYYETGSLVLSFSYTTTYGNGIWFSSNVGFNASKRAFPTISFGTPTTNTNFSPGTYITNWNLGNQYNSLQGFGPSVGGTSSPPTSGSYFYTTVTWAASIEL